MPVTKDTPIEILKLQLQRLRVEIEQRKRDAQIHREQLAMDNKDLDNLLQLEAHHIEAIAHLERQANLAQQGRDKGRRGVDADE